MTDKIPFTKKKVLNPKDYEKEFREARTKEWYNLERLLPYLEHFAEVEETTVEEQCIECFLLPEWKEFKEKNPTYPK